MSIKKGPVKRIQPGKPDKMHFHFALCKKWPYAKSYLEISALKSIQTSQMFTFERDLGFETAHYQTDSQQYTKNIYCLSKCCVFLDPWVHCGSTKGQRIGQGFFALKYFFKSIFSLNIKHRYVLMIFQDKQKCFRMFGYYSEPWRWIPTEWEANNIDFLLIFCV